MHICIYRITYMCVYIVLLGYLTKPCNSCAHLNLQYMYKDSFTCRKATYETDRAKIVNQFCK